MKLLIASDIHGDSVCCQTLLDVAEKECVDRILLLGDLLYHGPRNDLPEGYAPKKVIEMLNSVADKLICVRGNCESEVDQMVLNFPVLSETAIFFDGSRELYIFMSHGHKFSPENPPILPKGSVFLYGHTHIPKICRSGEIVCINPGSVSLPKENNKKSFALYENGHFEIKSFDGDKIAEISV